MATSAGQLRPTTLAIKLATKFLRAGTLLSGLVFGKPVRIVATDTDRYGRTVADVYARTNWVNPQMIADGWAWHYTRYSASQALADAQRASKDGRLGLWRDKDAVPPWEFRTAAK